MPPYSLRLTRADYLFIIPQNTPFCKRIRENFLDLHRGIFTPKLCNIHENTQNDKKTSLQNHDNVVYYKQPKRGITKPLRGHKR